MYWMYMSDERQSIGQNPPGPISLILRYGLRAERRAAVLRALPMAPTMARGARLAARRWARNALRETCADLP